jgi:hypothetical protein
MARFENNVLGLIPQKEWLDIPFVVNRPDNPIDQLFGDVKTANLVAYWESIAAEYQVPLMAQFHGFDTEAQKTFRVPVDTHNIEKGLIKVKIDQSERMRALTRAGVQNDEMYDYVINDGIRLAEQVITRTKVAKNELMASGKVTIKENDLDLTVDYGVPDAQKNLTVDFGAGASEALDEQLEDLVQTARDKGQTINGFMTSRATLNKFRKNANIQKAIGGSTAVGQLVPSAALRSYLLDEFQIANIIVNDATYGVSDGIDSETGRPKVKMERYFPVNGITFFATPNGGSKLGDGLWGDPPEADPGVERNNDVSGSSESPYVYISQWAENDPTVLWTKASTLFMPVLYVPNSLFIASAIETPGA